MRNPIRDVAIDRLKENPKEGPSAHHLYHDLRLAGLLARTYLDASPKATTTLPTEEAHSNDSLSWQSIETF